MAEGGARTDGRKSNMKPMSSLASSVASIRLEACYLLQTVSLNEEGLGRYSQEGVFSGRLTPYTAQENRPSDDVPLR